MVSCPLGEKTHAPSEADRETGPASRRSRCQYQGAREVLQSYKPRSILIYIALVSTYMIQGVNSSQILEGYFTPFNLLDCSAGFQCGIDNNFLVHCWRNEVVPKASRVSAMGSGQITSNDAGFVTVSCSLTTCCGVNVDKIECRAIEETDDDKSNSNSTNTLAKIVTLSNTPVIGGMWRTISVSEAYTCGIATVSYGISLSEDESELVCWGDVPVKPDDIVSRKDAFWIQAFTGISFICGLKSDGGVVCWEKGDSNNVNPNGGQYAVGAVGGNGRSLCLVTFSNEIECFVSSNLTSRSFLNPPVLGSDVQWLPAIDGGAFFCAISSDTQIHCWGDGSEDEMFVPPYQDGWTTVSVGSDQICGIRSGSMYCWGNIGNTTPPDIGTSWGFTGQELTESGNFPFVNTTSDSTDSSSNDSVALGLGLGVGIPVAIALIIGVVIFIKRRRYRQALKTRPLLEKSNTKLLNYTDGGQWKISHGNLEICQDENGKDIVLGKGGFGVVVKGIRNGVQEVAIKILDTTNSHVREACMQEADMMKVLHDQNIIHLYGISTDEDKIFVVMEFMAGGDLSNALHGDKGSEHFAWNSHGKQIALDLVKAVCYLHSMNIMHRDIKTKNVLLNQSWTLAKLGDVGVSRFMEDSEAAVECTIVGTMVYIAPEVLQGKYKLSADIYSLGVVLKELVTREKPKMSGPNRDPSSDECPSGIRDLIRQCLDPDPDKRPTAFEVHSIIKNSKDGESSKSMRYPILSKIFRLPSSLHSSLNQRTSQSAKTGSAPRQISKSSS